MDSVQHRDEILLAQSIDIVADDKLETAEATCNDLIAFMFK